MNEAAGRLRDAQNKLQLASRHAQRLGTAAAEQRGWLREHMHVRLHGSSGEHERLRRLLEDVGIAKVLARKLGEVERQKAGLDAHTLEEELSLAALVLDVGRVHGGVGARPRHFLRVRNQSTGEICLEWEEARDQRTTNPAGREGEECDALTRKLHDGDGGGGSASGYSSATSTPRSSVAGR